MLQIENLNAWYEKSQVLRGVRLHLQRGEIVALLGRSGSGRSTTAKAIMGLVDCEGRLLWQPPGALQPRQLAGLKPFEIARLGLGYVPEHREVFPRLTVQQNLLLGQKSTRPNSHWGFADAYRLFPRLKERQHVEAGLLSGGEQQMLALCRTMMGQPQLMLIDEPTEGLAPRLVEQVGVFLQELRNRGVTVLLIEQKLTLALEIADRCLVMGRGSIVFDGTPAQLRSQEQIRREWLGV